MGVFVTELADVLRGAGLNVVEVPGWQSRGWRGGTTPDGGLMGRPQGGLAHHTGTSATAGGDYPTLNTIIHGRSDVAGPLANLGLGRDGTWYVIAAGRTNHSGAVDDQRYFNAHALGVEAEHPGGAAGWPQAQYDSYVRGCAALGQHFGFTWRGHKEAAIPHGRKVDPNFDMDSFRAAILLGGGFVTPATNPAPAPAPRNYVQHGDTGSTVVELQNLLNAAIGSGLVVDGDFGPKTEQAVRSYQASRGLSADGIAGPDTLGALRSGRGPIAELQRGLVVDGDFGPLTKRALQRALGVADDGVVGPVTVRALQARVGAGVDGVWGPKTTKALQRYLGVTVDGVAGVQTYSALQARLNAGTF